MTVRRGLVLIAGFLVLALVRVHLRAEETRLTARIQALRAERVDLRRESWSLQLETARLRSPDQIRDRADRWRLEVHAPWTDPSVPSGSRYAGG